MKNNKWIRYFNALYLFGVAIFTTRAYYLIKNSPFPIGAIDGEMGGVVYYSYKSFALWLVVLLAIFVTYNLIYYFIRKRSFAK